MDKKYVPQQVEEHIYSFWEKAGYFIPKINLAKKPFTIIMPPPNANGALHIGHAIFVTLQDILIRYHRMKGDPTLWLPGADHAGILTQVVFERKLEKEESKSRYDLGREEFFRRCMEFTLANKKTMEEQLKRLGASCDWTRNSFTLDPKFNKPIYTVFKKLYDEGLLYRDFRMINWCPRCATALSDLEVIYKERVDSLYFLKYGPFTLATVRPETKFGDTAVAVHPGDERYKKWVGRQIEVEGLLGKFKMKVIADQLVDPQFGTGVVKVTPAHDPVDYEMGKRHNLGVKQVIGFDGKLNQLTGPYQGLRINKARQTVVADLQKKGLLLKIDANYQHSVGICERCKTTIEPMVSKQWFIKMEPLAKPAIQVVEKQEIKIVPNHFRKNYLLWMKGLRDWCISRQLWWGIQLPVWYCGKEGLTEQQLTMNPLIQKQLQSIKGCGGTIVSLSPPKKCPQCGNTKLIRDPDVLDTWFSSGQWPYLTLNWKQKNESDFHYFYPTTVMETGYEILYIWIARMIMLGIFATGKIPFEKVFLHGLVRDAFGEKMSKSRGNVINPLDMVNKYGADALRMALIFGTAAGNDSKIGEQKIAGMRNFTNKIWNISRFVLITLNELGNKKLSFDEKSLALKNLELKEDRNFIEKLDNLIKTTTENIDKFEISKALEDLYHFTWHEFADKYLEGFKSRKDNPESLCTLHFALCTILRLLHPFAPFVTEAIWSKLPKQKEEPLIISSLPHHQPLSESCRGYNRQR